MRRMSVFAKQNTLVPLSQCTTMSTFLCLFFSNYQNKLYSGVVGRKMLKELRHYFCDTLHPRQACRLFSTAFLFIKKFTERTPLPSAGCAVAVMTF